MTHDPEMSSSRPYLLRALYDWIVDNDMTPHLLVDASHEGVTVPSEYVEDDKIVLNVDPSAVTGLEMGNDWVMFHARFSGRSTEISFPVHATAAIYARENGQGMVFSEPTGDKPSPPPDGPAPDAPPPRGRPRLTVVK